jgi:hypothetical protein
MRLPSAVSGAPQTPSGVGSDAPSATEPCARWAALLALGLNMACAHQQTPARLHNDPVSWRAARQLLSSLRQAWRPSLRTLSVTVRFAHAASGRSFQGRGALATRPADSARLILVGPAGSTAMDLWLDSSHWRLAIPSLDRVARGGPNSPPSASRGLPVSLLRWWLVHPFEGRLIAAAEREGRLVLVTKDDQGAIVEVVPRAGAAVELVRHSGGHEERIMASNPGCPSAHYWSSWTGVDLNIRCEERQSTQEPDPRAFDDPDGQGPTDGPGQSP